MKEVDYKQFSEKAIEQLQKGAFLNVKSGDKINTMTIGWGSIGYSWKKPVFMVMVRYSRYTYELLKDAKEFTVSLPIDVDLSKQLSICGKKSGRDVDKFKLCDLTPATANKVDAPIIAECDLHYECKILFKQDIKEAELDNEFKDTFYKDNNFHVLFYGEIVGTYIKE